MDTLEVHHMEGRILPSCPVVETITGAIKVPGSMQLTKLAKLKIDQRLWYSRLIVVVHGDQSPVGDNSSKLNTPLVIGTSDKILDSSSVEKLNVGELEDLAQNGAGEESSMLDDNIVLVVRVLLIWDTELSEEGIRRLPHDHSRKQLTTEPSTAARGNAGLHYGDLQVGTRLGKAVGSAQTTRTSSDDDDVGLGVLIEVIKVAPGHGTHDLALTDGLEREVLPATSHGLDGLRLGVTADWHSSAVGESHLA